MAEEKDTIQEEQMEARVEEKTKTSTDASVESAEEVEVPTKFQDIVSKIEEMTVLELSELVKVLEKKFGVSSAAPMMVASAGVSAAGGAGGEEAASSTVNVELTDAGGNKIGVIKALREVTELGLKEAKDLADGAPKMVKEGVARKEAEEMKKKLEAAGAKVTLK